MNDDILHDRENSEDTQRHLQENHDKFEADAVFLFKEMLRGERLTAKTVVQKYGKEPRRLRDLHIAGKCEKEWKLNEKGKRMYVEYFITPQHPPTKADLQKWFTEWQNEQPTKILTQQNLFDL